MSSEKRRRRKRDRILRTFTRRHDHRASSAASEEHADGGRQHVASEAATAASAASAAASTAADAEVVRLEQQIANVMRRTTAFQSAQDVYAVQDLLFRRFRAKYAGSLGSDYLSEQQAALLTALMKGNVPAIRRSLASGESWDFVFPPAPYAADGSRVMQLEGRCRSPLALLVRPDEGNLVRLLPGVSQAERLALIEEALSSGAADANYPRGYWSSPGAHACFEGDVEALSLLHRFGLNLEQKVEWLLQPSPSFTYAHAAAFNGNANVLTFMRQRVRPSVFLATDGDGSNPLHTLMESSRNLQTAELLLELGVDGYCKNGAGRSALSMSIETLPALAARLLDAKSRFEYRWWGNDLFWYSFDGVVLPLDGPASPLAFAPLDGGPPLTVDQLVVKHKRKELLSTPLLRSLVGRKWRDFGAGVFWRRTAQYLFLVGAAFANSLDLRAGGADPAVVASSPVFVVSTLALLGSWPFFFSVESAGVRRNGLAAHFGSAWNVLDAGHLLAILALPPLHFLPQQPADAGALEASAYAVAQSLPGLLQLSFAVRGLEYASLFRSLGPLLVTVRGMLVDITRFGGLYAFVLIGFANAFFVLFALSGESLDYGGYPRILQEQLLWLLSSVDRSLLDGLTGQLHATGDVLFWGYIVLSYFVLLNLLIAVFNSTFEKVQRQAFNEWLFLRMATMLDFEARVAQPPRGGQQNEPARWLDAYYGELEDTSNSRSVELGVGGAPSSSSRGRSI